VIRIKYFKMNVDNIKVELIDWITRLNDQNSIERVLSLKKDITKKNHKSTRIFGSGKHLIGHISEDFNEPLEIFNEYQK
jgi:hypothetical protein